MKCEQWFTWRICVLGMLAACLQVKGEADDADLLLDLARLIFDVGRHLLVVRIHDSIFAIFTLVGKRGKNKFSFFQNTWRLMIALIDRSSSAHNQKNQMRKKLVLLPRTLISPFLI